MNTRTWSRDFAVVGGATGAAAPFFVIFDPGFALAAGLAGAASGLALGAVAARAVAWLRPRVPLPVLVAGMAGAGAWWGAISGVVGGAASSSGPEAMVLGFVLGATTGMVALGGWFLPYLVASVRGDATAPVVLGGVLLAPVAGWLGLAALVASTFGLWLFALPALLWAGVAVDRQLASARVRALP